MERTPDLSISPSTPLSGAKRFFAPLDSILTDFPVELEVTDALVVHHLGTVMRARAGETVIITDDRRETSYLATIRVIEKKRVVCDVSAQLPAASDPLPHTTLAVALIKEQRWDWLLQKATELGVRRIQPLFSERCIIRLSSADVPKKLERWAGVLRSAAEQSEGLFIPTLSPPLSLTQFLQDAPTEAQRLVLAERGPNRMTIKSRLRLGNSQQSVILTVGPEGGWTEHEQAAFTQAGFTPVSLGHRILRSETAAIAAMAALVAEYSD